jgi:DNA-directed RNA polymerase specialized sigma54-like protein
MKSTMTKQLPFHEAVRLAMDSRPNKWLSEKTGIHESEISRILSGRLTPSDDQLSKIKGVFPDLLINY